DGAVGACMALLVSSERTLRSVVCGVMMLVVWVAYPAYCCCVVLVRGRCGGVFVLRSDAVREKRSTELNALREAVDFATEPTHEWVAARVAGPREREHAILLLRHMEPVFEAYVGRREWYFAVEWAFAMLSGGVLGAAEAVASNSGANACVAAQWGVGCAVGLSALQLVMCLWLRPFAVRLELWMALLLGGLELVGNALSLGDETAAAGVVVSVSAYLELVSSKY
ncbi:transmembrane protein, putative, partial [Bodo saltans]